MEISNIPTSGSWSTVIEVININTAILEHELLRLSQVSPKNLGIYSNSYALGVAHPSPEPGEYAFVSVGESSDETLALTLYVSDGGTWYEGGRVTTSGVTLNNDYLEMAGDATESLTDTLDIWQPE